MTGVQLRTLQSLVGKSLLRRDPHSGRYEIHELLRHYAEEQLELSGEADDVYQTHAQYFANFMAERWPLLKGHQQKDALQEIESEIENARTAWAYWIRAENVAELKKFLHSFWVIYDIRAWYPAGIELFEQGVQKNNFAIIFRCYTPHLRAVAKNRTQFPLPNPEIWCAVVGAGQTDNIPVYTVDDLSKCKNTLNL